MFPFGFTIRSELERTRDVHYLWRGLERALVRRAPGRPCPADTDTVLYYRISNIETDREVLSGKPDRLFVRLVRIWKQAHQQDF